LSLLILGISQACLLVTVPFAHRGVSNLKVFWRSETPFCCNIFL